MNRGTVNAAADGDLIDPAQCDYLSPIDGSPCQGDAGHHGGHSIGGNPRYSGAVDPGALLARVRELRATDDDADIPAPRTAQVVALARLIARKK